MGRIGSATRAVGLITLCLAGCPSDGGGADTDTDTDTDAGTTSPSTMSATNPVTSGMDASASQTTATPTTDPMTTSPTTNAVTMGSTTEPPPDTTTGGDDCEACLEEACGKAIAACEKDESCGCWLECLEGGGTFPMCAGMCGGPPPKTFMEFLDCIDTSCVDECAGTDTEGPAGIYDPCDFRAPCPDDLECNMFVNYCSIDCSAMACPDPPDGDAVPECSGFTDNCILPCAGGETCPSGMTCQDFGGPGELCAF